MKILKNFIFLSILMMLTWLLLTDSIQSDELIIGAGLSLLLGVVFAKRDVFGQISLSPKSIVFIPIYFLVFIWALIKANVDVASRVIRPSLPIKPGIVKVKTSLKSKMGRFFLANSITLTPGTLSVDIKDDILYIHWIDVTGKNVQESTEKISATFEKYLEVIFG